MRRNMLMNAPSRSAQQTATTTTTTTSSSSSSSTRQSQAPIRRRSSSSTSTSIAVTRPQAQHHQHHQQQNSNSSTTRTTSNMASLAPPPPRTPNNNNNNNMNTSVFSRENVIAAATTATTTAGASGSQHQQQQGLPERYLPHPVPNHLIKSDEQCSICLSDLKSVSMVRESCCGHHFCSPCILKWFSTKTKCPNCSQDQRMPPRASSPLRVNRPFGVSPIPSSSTTTTSNNSNENRPRSSFFDRWAETNNVNFVHGSNNNASVILSPITSSSTSSFPTTQQNQQQEQFHRQIQDAATSASPSSSSSSTPQPQQQQEVRQVTLSQQEQNELTPGQQLMYTEMLVQEDLNSFDDERRAKALSKRHEGAMSLPEILKWCGLKNKRIQHEENIPHNQQQRQNDEDDDMDDYEFSDDEEDESEEAVMRRRRNAAYLKRKKMTREEEVKMILKNQQEARLYAERISNAKDRTELQRKTGGKVQFDSKSSSSSKNQTIDPLRNHIPTKKEMESLASVAAASQKDQSEIISRERAVLGHSKNTFFGGTRMNPGNGIILNTVKPSGQLLQDYIGFYASYETKPRE